MRVRALLLTAAAALLLGALGPVSAVSRSLDQVATGYTRLKTFTYTDPLFSDDYSCYTTTLPSGRTKYVPRGVPKTCGLGCQYAKSVSTNDTQATSMDAMTGPPDFWPQSGDSPKAFKPSSSNQAPAGASYLTVDVTVNSKIYVSKVRVYETDHPGAIVKISGFTDSTSGLEYVLWEAPKGTNGKYTVYIPAGSSQYDPVKNVLTTASRIFEPPVKAPRDVQLSIIRLYMDVAQVDGTNALDAIEVWGDDATGVPVEDYGTVCANEAAINCWHACRTGDLVTTARASAAETVLSDAAQWLMTALTVPTAGSSPLTVALDPANQGDLPCDDVPLPPYFQNPGLYAAGLLVVPTLRPDRVPVKAYPCRPTNRALVAGSRPTAIRVNIVPGFAEAALKQDAAERGTRLRRAAADAVLHEMYKALGWGWDSTSVTARNAALKKHLGADMISYQSTTTCTSFVDCASDFANRYLIKNTAPAILSQARTHFASSSMLFVEMETNYGDGLYAVGADPDCMTDQAQATFNFLPSKCNPGLLLEHRIFLGELMTTAMYSKLAYFDTVAASWVFQTGPEVKGSTRTGISLAMFDDLGYFKPDYSASELLTYGHGMGDAFVSQSCVDWPTAAQRYLCPIQGQGFTGNDNIACSPQRTHKGRCLLTNWTNPPTPYRYGSNTLGLSAALDYCPVVAPGGYVRTSGNAPTADPTKVGGQTVASNAWTACNVPRQEPTPASSNTLNEETGPPSRCFSVTQTGSASAGCYKMHCDGNTLYIKMLGTWKACVATNVYFESTPPGSGVTVTCPTASEVCSTFQQLTGPFVEVYGLPDPQTTSTAVSSPTNLILIQASTVKVTVETGTFRVGVDGNVLQVLVGGGIIATFSDPWPNNTDGSIALSYAYTVKGLPATPSTGSTLVFQLVDKYGAVQSAQTFYVYVQHTGITQGVTQTVTGSSQYTPFDPNNNLNPAKRPFTGVAETNYPTTITPSVMGDSTDAWAPQSAGGRTLDGVPLSWLTNQWIYEEYLDVKVTHAVIPTQVTVYENLAPGSLVRVQSAVTTNSVTTYVPAWERLRPARSSMTTPAIGANVQKTVYQLRTVGDNTPELSDTFRLSWGLKRTSWPEVASIGITGDAAEMPHVADDPRGLPAEAIVGLPDKATATVQFTLDTTATLVWSTPTYLRLIDENCAPTGGSSCVDSALDLQWGRVINQSGVAFGPGTVSVGVAIDTSLMSRADARRWMAGGAEGYVVLYNALFPTNAQPTGWPVARPVVATRRVTDGITLRGPACAHGVVYRTGPLDSGECQCFPGAYGPACEFLSCPAGCAKDGVPAGVCDHSTGTCLCLDGHYGVDCSGVVGTCVLSYDGSCPAGYKEGTYTINAEDDNNLNRAIGTVPESMQCGSSSSKTNAFDCTALIDMDLCCRPSANAGCPFASGSDPCTSSSCPSSSSPTPTSQLQSVLQSDSTGGWRAPKCLAVVQHYCFYHPEDAACHAFAPIPIPADFACPTNLAARFCAANRDDPDCAAFVAWRTCGFAPASGICQGSACKDSTGNYDFTSQACRAAVMTYCASATDPACNLQGFGSGCLFAAGSPPCEAVACQMEYYQVGPCKAVVDSYCGSAAGPNDPQCLVLGYGGLTANEAPYAMPLPQSTCPLALAQKQCNLMPLDATCVMLAQYGLIAAAAPLPALQPPSALQSAASADTRPALQLLKSAALAADVLRQQDVSRQAMYRELFDFADGDADGLLVAEEVALALNVIKSWRLSGNAIPASRGFLSAIDDATLATGLALSTDPSASSGNHFTRSDFYTAMETLYLNWVDAHGAPNLWG